MDTADFWTELEPLVPALRRRAHRLTSSKEDAEDLLQDTLLHCWRKRDLYKDDHLLGWAYTILRHKWINNHRKKVVRPFTVPGEWTSPDGEELEWQPADPSPSPEDQIMEHELRQDFEAALGSINPDQAAVFTLFEQGHTYAEISEMLDIPMGTVMSRLWRARQALQGRMPELVA